MPGGRPTKYNKKLIAKFCARLTQGQSVREICKSDDMPSTFTIFLWLGTYPEFSEQYAKAKAAGIEALAEDLLDIADDSSNDWMERNDPDNPGFVANGEAIARARLRVDTRKWILSKLAAKKYGEKVDHKIDGSIDHKHTVEQISETDSWIESIIGSGEETEDQTPRTH